MPLASHVFAEAASAATPHTPCAAAAVRRGAPIRGDLSPRRAPARRAGSGRDAGTRHASSIRIPMSTTHQLRGRVVPFAARIEATGRAPRVLERRGWLTGYSAETLADDALHAGAGARVDVHVPA